MTDKALERARELIEREIAECKEDGHMAEICRCQMAQAIAEAAERAKNEPALGCATTRQLLDELYARIEINGDLDYRTIDHD